MRVCMVLKKDYNMFKKDSRVIREATALVESGHVLYLILCSFNDNNETEYLQHEGINIIQISIKNPMDYLRKAVKELKNLGLQVCHCHDYETLFIGYYLKLITRCILIYDSHEICSEEHPARSFSAKIRRWKIILGEYLLLRRVDGVITVSESFAEILSSRFKITKPTVVRNVPKLPTNYDDTDFLRHRLKIDKSKKIVLYQGGMMFGRGLENLINAVKYVRDNVVFVFMGFGGMYSYLEILSKKSNRIYVLPAVSPKDLINYTKCGNIGMNIIQNTCMNNYYSSPNKVFEYILAGVPILASNFPEMIKLTEGEKLGLSIDSNSPLDIAEKINYLLDAKNTSLYNKIKNNCNEKGKSKYNWEKEKEVLIDMYKNIEKVG